jgi:hypothetical protein
MASSTTVPIARTSAKSVSRLIEKPATERKANVPTSDTMIETEGMSVERISCRKTYTTRITSRMASISVLITSLIEAKRKSFTLCRWAMETPLGSSASISASRASISFTTCVAFEPAVWKTIVLTPG